MKFKIYKIIKMPPQITIKKIYKRIYRRIYYSIRKFQVLKFGIDIDNSYFINWKTTSKLFFDSENENYYIQNLEIEGVKDIIILQADKVYEHNFNLLGSGDYKFTEKIKWNQDFKTGFDWENDFYLDIKTIDLNNDSDVKIPWELSRFQHIVILGQAYWITKNEKYSLEFMKQIEEWMIENPVEYSVNWTCSMDVAIRACNWIIGYKYFEKSRIPNEFWTKYNKWLFFHGDFIYKNLEKGYPSNNHYISNLVGLVWLGIYFVNLDYKKTKTRKWLKFALRELELEMEKQVYNDGFNFEASTAYHCLVTELLLYTSILCDANKVEFSSKFKKKLEKMCEIILNITKPNGQIPLFGDMDNGRFIMFTSYGDEEMRDFRYLLGVAGEYFDRDDFRYHASNQLAALWMFPKLKLKEDTNYELKSVSYPEGGVHVLRNDKVYLAVRCGQNGTSGKGGHTHNDQLSFELNIQGEDFIVDPGTYTYTSDYKLRNLFRSTYYHNTLQVNNLEQNNFHTEHLFSMKDETNAKLIDFTQNLFSGEHYGFVSKAGLVHFRSIEIKEKVIVLFDSIKNELKDEINVIFHIAPRIKVSLENKVIKLEGENVKIELTFDNNNEILIEDGFCSSKYGYKETSKIIIVKSENKLITKINIL